MEGCAKSGEAYVRVEKTVSVEANLRRSKRLHVIRSRNSIRCQRGGIAIFLWDFGVFAGEKEKIKKIKKVVDIYQTLYYNSSCVKRRAFARP